MRIYFNKELQDLYFDTETQSYNNMTHEQFMRYMVGRFSNKDRLIGRWAKPNVDLFKEQINHDNNPKEVQVEETAKFEAFVNRCVDDFEEYKPYSFGEAWSIKNQSLQKSVFDTIDIAEMITELNGEKIKVDGINLDNILYNRDGSVKEVKNQDNIYEVFRCDATKLDIGQKYIYALKMWCTTTNEEHFIWIDENVATNPLEAIASTFRIHKNVWDKTVAIKRQGDILAVETSEEVVPEGEEITLTAQQYFDKLVAQS